jgi:hypothetical protein
MSSIGVQAAVRSIAWKMSPIGLSEKRASGYSSLGIVRDSRSVDHLNFGVGLAECRERAPARDGLVKPCFASGIDRHGSEPRHERGIGAPFKGAPLCLPLCDGGGTLRPRWSARMR